MPAFAQSVDEDPQNRAANDDDINGGSGTRTKYTYVDGDPINLGDVTGMEASNSGCVGGVYCTVPPVPDSPGVLANVNVTCDWYCRLLNSWYMYPGVGQIDFSSGGSQSSPRQNTSNNGGGGAPPQTNRFDLTPPGGCPKGTSPYAVSAGTGAPGVVNCLTPDERKAQTDGEIAAALSAIGGELGPAGSIFGRTRLGGSSLFGINSNALLRIGWGWSGTAADGVNVFRISGNWVKAIGVSSGHIDLFSYTP